MYNRLHAKSLLTEFYDSYPYVIKVYIPVTRLSGRFTRYDFYCWFDQTTNDPALFDTFLGKTVTCEVKWSKPELAIYLFPNIADPWDELGPVVRSYTRGS